MRTKTIQIPQTIYVADDGAEFTSENQCELYEYRSKLQPVWIVFPRTCWSQKAAIEVYSTENLAKNSLKNVNNKNSFIIRKYYIDEIQR